MSPVDNLTQMATGFLLAAVVTALVVAFAAFLGAPRALLRTLVWAVPTAVAVLLFVISVREIGAAT